MLTPTRRTTASTSSCSKQSTQSEIGSLCYCLAGMEHFNDLKLVERMNRQYLCYGDYVGSTTSADPRSLFLPCTLAAAVICHDGEIWRNMSDYRWHFSDV